MHSSRLIYKEYEKRLLLSIAISAWVAAVATDMLNRASRLPKGLRHNTVNTVP